MKNSTKYKLLTIIMLITFQIIFLQVSAVSNDNDTLTTNESSEWWQPDWFFRRTIEINNLGGNLTDFQVLLEFNEPNFNYTRAMPNGNDIRVIDSENNTLSYWIEKWNSDGSSKIWVNVPYIEANNTLLLDLYYGYPFANPLSCGDDTFSFFDDFDGFTLDETKWIGSGHINNTYLSTNDIQTKSFFANKSLHIIEAKAKCAENNESKDFGLKLFGDNESGSPIHYQAGFNLAGNNTQEIHQYSPTTQLNSTNYNWTTDEFYLFKAWRTDDNRTHLYNERYIDGSNGNELVSPVDEFRDIGYVGLYESSSIDNASIVDWFRVRKFAEIEPFVYIGNEQFNEETLLPDLTDFPTFPFGINIATIITSVLAVIPIILIIRKKKN